MTVFCGLLHCSPAWSPNRQTVPPSSPVYGPECPLLSPIIKIYATYQAQLVCSFSPRPSLIIPPELIASASVLPHPSLVLLLSTVSVVLHPNMLHLHVCLQKSPGLLLNWSRGSYQSISVSFGILLLRGSLQDLSHYWIKFLYYILQGHSWSIVKVVIIYFLNLSPRSLLEFDIRQTQGQIPSLYFLCKLSWITWLLWFSVFSSVSGDQSLRHRIVKKIQWCDVHLAERLSYSSGR